MIADAPPVRTRPSTRRSLSWVWIGMWVALAVAVAIWVHFEPPGWDLKVYTAAIHSMRAGHDPYADAIARQQVYHQVNGNPDGVDRPYSYVYSPITLPILRLIGRVPFALSGSVYWVLYILAIVGQIPIILRLATRQERTLFLFLTPAAAFFPGLVQGAVVLSGNIAYILYFALFWSALVGWRRGRWIWFYTFVLIASCIKAPMLSLVVIPALSARKQWLHAGLTAAAGVALFAVQPMLWPSLFANFMKAVNLQFLYNRDFGCSPAGLFSAALFRMGRSYSPAGFIFYVCYALPVFALLVHLSRDYLRGRFPLRQWIPVMLVGVILLNPRILDYDVAAVTLPLILVAWRFLARSGSTLRTCLYFAVFFAVANIAGASSANLVRAQVLPIVFAAGCWDLTRTHAPTHATVDELTPMPATP